MVQSYCNLLPGRKVRKAADHDAEDDNLSVDLLLHLVPLLLYHVGDCDDSVSRELRDLLHPYEHPQNHV